MEYTKEEDKKYIENLINHSFKIKYDDYIYFVTNKNILRYLKYNKLLNINQKIKFDLTNENLSKQKIEYYLNNYTILFTHKFNQKEQIVLFEYLHLHFESKYNKDFLNIYIYIKNIIYDIIKD